MLFHFPEDASQARCQDGCCFGPCLPVKPPSHLQDGMAEFLTLIRGCNLIAGDEASLGSDSAFQAFREETPPKHAQPHEHLNSINPTDLDLATLSLHTLSHLPMSACKHTYQKNPPPHRRKRILAPHRNIHHLCTCIQHALAMDPRRPPSLHPCRQCRCANLAGALHRHPGASRANFVPRGRVCSRGRPIKDASRAGKGGM